MAAGVSACRRNSTSARARASEGDRAYIDAMVPHHQAGIMLADQAIQRANHQELKVFAADVRAEEAGEITLLQGWRTAWFDSASTPAPVPPADIPAGADFDLAWMRAMIAHHQQAIELSRLALRSNARGETDSLALHVIAQDTSEQRQLRAWAKQWYGVTLARVPADPPGFLYASRRE
jgi:uncharacterized protein (DUF305 family)